MFILYREEAVAGDRMPSQEELVFIDAFIFDADGMQPLLQIDFPEVALAGVFQFGDGDVIDLQYPVPVADDLK